jgi:hypothetical protein
MHDANEPDHGAPHALTPRERTRLIRALNAHGLWPLRLPLFDNRRRQQRKPGATPRARQPWEPKSPRSS